MNGNLIINAISAISNLFTIVASGIAIYIFLFKKEQVKTIIKILSNYTSQITLSELRLKLDRLNDLNAGEDSEKSDVVNVFNEIVGQIRGNSKLMNEFQDIFEKLTNYAENPNVLTEPRKRSIVSELRERLRQVDVHNFDQIFGGRK